MYIYIYTYIYIYICMYIYIYPSMLEDHESHQEICAEAHQKAAQKLSSGPKKRSVFSSVGGRFF